MSEIEYLEAFFNSVEIPKNYQLEKGTTIIDSEKFLNSHFVILEGDKNRQYFLHLQRLIVLMNKLKAETVKVHEA